MSTPSEPQILVTEHGPYRVVGKVEVRDVAGNPLRSAGAGACVAAVVRGTSRSATPPMG